MKIFGILIIVFAGFYFFVYPPLSQEKKCYDSAQKGTADIAYYSASRGWSQSEICKKRTEILLELGDCIHTVKSSFLATKYANNLVEGVLPLIRPTAKGYTTQKEEHNADCSEYESAQLE